MNFNMNPNMNFMNMNPNMMMNMMNGMNGMNNFNGQVKPQVFDPTRIDKKTLGFLAKQTVYNSRVSQYEKLPKFKHSLWSFVDNYKIDDPSKLCEVSVEYDHSLDVAEKYACKGTEYNMVNPFMSNQLYPVIINVVGREFCGSNLEINEEMRDELINIRTTFSNTLDKNSQFPLKNEESTYLKIVNVIRPSYPMMNGSNMFLQINKTFGLGMITICPIETKKLLSGKTFFDGKMYANDFIETITAVECIFQQANFKKHQVLILPPFGNNEHDNNPVDDIIKIYNYCILKYGHLFKKIIIAVPKYYPKEIFNRYNKGIIKPNELVTDIDKKYEKEEIKKQVMLQQNNQTNSQKLKKKVTKKQNKTSSEQDDSEQPIQPQNGYSQEQMEMFMKMMPTMMAMMQGNQ